jgi:hypothetical protein
MTPASIAPIYGRSTARRPRWEIEIIEKLCQVLDVDPAEFFPKAPVEVAAAADSYSARVRPAPTWAGVP